ncbi:hypothetical protein HNR42_002317 [Deinobacterium chartae]|uniref:Acetoacetate decarboxylase n=1 Tax=Deinobacterium chartae TaxID=521158 RepID=A0A841I4H3_9DEIO|nr:acetoacetate decarboxylase family protein [Deinobacterium chartae]MBB6098882.1 hypothetical protein [Deinobacterium chartae]
MIPPAPWHLTGRGLIIGVRLEDHQVPAVRRERWLPGPGAVMLVDYRHSDAGPYRELLCIPGLYRTPHGLRPHIPVITVSHALSARGGQQHWGLPKTVSDFRVEREGDLEAWTVTQGGAEVLRLLRRAGGPAFALPLGLLPAALRTLWQPTADGARLTTPGGYGWVRPARLEAVRVNGSLFPDFSGSVLGALEVTHFRLTFPRARLS